MSRRCSLISRRYSLSIKWIGLKCKLIKLTEKDSLILKKSVLI
nr:MAG TPA: hypothetical protein [Bacteriophage sp.]